MSGRTLARLVIATIWVLFVAIVVAVGLELFLNFRWLERREVKKTGKERYDALSEGYHPFAVQHINPTYLFFLPFDPAERVALSNEFVTIDSAGFRGPGPESAGDRKLAFLVGGSTAFSYSSADSTSITGYLNRLQDRYFFVNAGVPSWNSTQELFRLAHQILEYDPDFVLAFDGANDMAIVVQHHEEGLDYPPGTPESFDELQELVDDIRAGSVLTGDGGFLERLFPRLTQSIRAKLSDRRPVGPIAHEKIERAAKKYVYNLNLMHALVESSGGRFASVFQPIIWLHRNPPPIERGYPYREAYEHFHEAVFADTVDFERFDFSDVFDSYFEQIPFFDPEGEKDLTDDAIFVDPVHVFDRGNRLIAERIVSEVFPLQ